MGKHDKKSKKKHKKHKKERRQSTSSSSSNVSDEWVEKQSSPIMKKELQEKERDEWMNLPTLFTTASSSDRRKEREEAKRKDKELSTYDPSKSTRELNPYWKSGGDGLPSLSQKSKFMKPGGDEDRRSYSSHNKARSSRSSWRKRSPEHTDSRRKEHSERRHRDRRSPEKRDKIKYDASSSDIIFTNVDSPPHPSSNKDEIITSESLTDKEMNDIAAKLVKAEILGNTAKINELKQKLERAREARKNAPSIDNKEENILLLRTDAKGFSTPLEAPEISDYKRKKKAETHDSGKRQKYYADDDKYNLKQMFEKERFNTTAQQDAEFIKLTAKASKMDDLDDIFVDKIRNEKSDEKKFQKERDVAIREHQKMSESLDNCQHCLQSSAMQKHLMVCLGETVYLSLPPCEPLTDGHCLIIPLRHVTCSTQLDENEWAEISDFRKSLTKMFLAKDEDVIFYETVYNVHGYSHMVLDCVPVPKDQGDLAPIYFKKAIDECETEWSTNKKLINLSGKDVRRAVPKGLPYFFVSFGMSEGFAHVIEDQRYFPKFFAAEIIGGILDLHHSKWRKQQNEKFDKQKMRVLQFSDMWQKYDCTNKL